MLPRWQQLLVRLLCALLVGAGVPGQRGASCGANGDGASCTTKNSCCCPVDPAATQAVEAERCCDCETPSPKPAPAPQPEPAKSPLPFAEAPPARAPPIAAHDDPTHSTAARTNSLPHGPLPKVARRIAYSVWRL